MSGNTETQKICPACGQANKSDDSFCRNCGGNLEGIDPVKNEAVQVPNNLETNKIEFKVSYKTKKNVLKYCVLSFLIFVIFIVILPILIFPESLRPIGFIVTVVLFVFLLAPTLILLQHTFWLTKDLEKIRTFSISDQAINIILPNKPSLQINWSDFNTIQMYKYKVHSGFGKGPMIGNLRAYKMNFFSNDSLIKETSLEISKDFNKSMIKRIRSHIEQYANRLNKEYIWGKNIQKVRRKREKKQKKKKK